MSLCCNVLRSYHDECDGYILHFKQWYQPKTKSLFHREVKCVTEAATLPYSWAMSVTWRLLLIIRLVAPESYNMVPPVPLAPNPWPTVLLWKMLMLQGRGFGNLPHMSVSGPDQKLTVGCCTVKTFLCRRGPKGGFCCKTRCYLNSLSAF